MIDKNSIIGGSKKKLSKTKSKKNVVQKKITQRGRGRYNAAEYAILVADKAAFNAETASINAKKAANMAKIAAHDARVAAKDARLAAKTAVDIEAATLARVKLGVNVITARPRKKPLKSKKSSVKRYKTANARKVPTIARKKTTPANKNTGFEQGLKTFWNKLTGKK